MTARRYPIEPLLEAMGVTLGQASRLLGIGGPEYRRYLALGMTRDTAELIPPIVFDTGFVGGAEGRLTGYFATLGGKVWRDVGVEFALVIATIGLREVALLVEIGRALIEVRQR